MMTRFAWFASFLLLLVPLAETAKAQFVRIGGFGGVSVRAPFVAVDVLPFGGGTRVRAPFTRVNTGAYRYGAYYYGHHPYRHYHGHGHVVYGAPVAVYPPPIVYEPVPVYPAVPAYPPAVAAYPSEAATAYPPSGPLPERLHQAASRLAESLSLRRGDADVWLDYLRPDLIIDVIDQGADPAELSGLVANYDGVVTNRSLGSIRAASGFSETRSLLKRFVAGSPAATSNAGSAGVMSAKPAGGETPADAPSADVPLPPQLDDDTVPTGPVPPAPAPAAEPTQSDESEPTGAAPAEQSPRADQVPTPAAPIKTASGGQVPTPL